MAVRRTIKDLIDGKGKKGGAMEGLKDFFTSPQTLFTIGVAILLIVYVNHKTKEA
jgi:hypothetical protein